MDKEKRRASWQRYNLKRKRDPVMLEHLRKIERARMETEKLTKLGICEVCKKKTSDTQWHHLDYFSPPNVLELCRKCHRREHPR